MKTLGLVSLLAFLTLGLTSFRQVPEEAFVPPPVIREPLPPMLPYVIPDQYRWWVERYAYESGVPVWIAARLFAQESTGSPISGAWDPRAVSWMGAQGLAQLMPLTRQYLEVKYNGGRPIDPFDPEQAIRFGLAYLSDLYEVSGKWSVAIAAYNGGLARWINPKRYGSWMPETISYVHAILGVDIKGVQ